MGEMVELGVQRSLNGLGDAYLCSSVVGMRFIWPDGAYTLACDTCGVQVREVTDGGTGETYVLYRAGDRWYEWAGAPALDRVRSGAELHPSGDQLARRERRLREVVEEDDLAGGVRGEVREQS